MNRFKKIAIWAFGVFFSLILLVFIGFYFFESKLKQQIIITINEHIDGEIMISTIEYNLFSTYPNAQLKIENVEIYENKNDRSSEGLILKLEEIQASLNLDNILDGNYVIDELSVNDGMLNVINYEDSTLNILNAIGDSPKSEEAGEPISLELKKTKIRNFRIDYSDYINKQVVSTNLDSLQLGLKLNDDMLFGNVSFDLKLNTLSTNDKKLFENHRISLTTNFNGNLDSMAFTAANGDIKFDLLSAKIDGYYNQLDSGFVDIQIAAQHSQLDEFVKMKILKSENLPDIRAGELAVDAHIYGKTLSQLPLIDANVNLRNLQVFNSYGSMIERGGFNLTFNSESTTDFLAAKATVDSVDVVFGSGGFLKGRAEVLNFKKPSFTVSWKAQEDLDEIYKLIEIPVLEKLQGSLNSSGNLSGQFDIENNKLLHHKGDAFADFENVSFKLKGNEYSVKNINGRAYLKNEDMGLENFAINANGNSINLSGRVNNLAPYILKKPTQLVASVSMQSDKMNTETLLAFDTALANNTKYKIAELDMEMGVSISSKSLASYELIPTGKLDIKKLTLLVEGAPPIIDFSGKIEVDKELAALKSFKGIIGKSHVDFSVSTSNYAAFVKSGTTEQMIVDVSLNSEKANAKDFFTFNHKFVLPKNYEEEVLKNVAINLKIITTNTELQKKDLLPELELQLTGLQFQTLYSPVVFKDIFVFGLVKDNNVYVNSMFGKFGRSDVFMNAQFDNVVATQDTISRPLKSRVSFNAGVLDLDELIKLDATETEVDSTAIKAEPTNPFAEKFPITDFQVNIGELTYFGEVIKNLKGIIKIDANNMIEMQQVSLESGEYGSFEFNGTLDASSRTEAILKSTIKITDVDLSNLNVKYIQNEEEVKISDHFEGKINGEVVADIPILPDFSFDLARLTGKIKVKMTDGALINYAPLEEMGKYFKNKDLNRVKFDELKNTMIFNGGKMLLPFMTINTTLGTINLMGFQTLDYDMKYDIQVPIKLVAGSALNSLFAAKKGDDGKADKVKKGGKGKYVTVHISGSADAYKFKLGKKHVLTAPPGFAVD